MANTKLPSWLRDLVNLLDQGFSTEDSSIVLAVEGSAEQDAGTLELPSEHNAHDGFYAAKMSFLERTTDQSRPLLKRGSSSSTSACSEASENQAKAPNTHSI